MKQHKWHKEIKAWADGAEIEMWYGDRWEQVHHIPEWNMEAEFRIKPQPITEFTDKQLEKIMEALTWAKENPITQPKEPKYLYAYKDYVRDDGSTTSKITISSTFLDTEFYIGKIKLEDDDGNT